jgi:hypothetical protein
VKKKLFGIEIGYKRSWEKEQVKREKNAISWCKKNIWRGVGCESGER